VGFFDGINRGTGERQIMKDQPIIETTEGKFIPQSLGQKCPVCNGFGSLKFGTILCHGCEGKGYILVPVQEFKDQGGQNG
jgi:hypothetical protein